MGTLNNGINGTLANGLIAHWCFTDSSLADISGNAINLNGSATFGTDKDGNSNCALLKTGQVTESTYRENSKIICASYNWTISFFIKFDNNDESMVPVAQGVYKTGGYYFQRNSDTLDFGIHNPGTKKNIITPSMDWTVWRNVIVTIDSSGIAEMYIDNIFAGTVNLSGITVWSSFYIGKYYADNTLPFSGKIDEFRIYNRKITELERAEINMMGVNYEVDVTPPTFNTINTSDTSSTSTKLNINCNEDATAYYKILSKSDAEPTPLQLKNSHDGIINLTANITSQTVISLNEKQSYKLVVIAEDLHDNVQNNITVINLDIAPPTFNTINTSNITSSSVDLNINCSENATAYYKMYSRGATAPTSAQLKSTHDGEIDLLELVNKSTNIYLWKGNTNYDLYVVAEDEFGNIQTTPTKLQFTSPLFTASYPPRGNKRYDVKLNEFFTNIATQLGLTLTLPAFNDNNWDVTILTALSAIESNLKTQLDKPKRDDKNWDVKLNRCLSKIINVINGEE